MLAMASNSWRRPAGGRRGGKHRGVVDLNSKYPQTSDLLRPLSTSFSHIQIISNPPTIASVDHPTTDGKSSAQVVFQSSSYTESVRKTMTAPSNLEGSASNTASLANNMSGTTFAAKARAAELNAVRSRRAAQEAEIQSEIPPIPPMPLGAIKFTRHRNRARAWKALNLDELAEESGEAEETHSERMPSVESFRPPPDQESNNGSTDPSIRFLSHQNSPISEPINRPDIKVTLPQYQSSMISSRQLTPENAGTPHSHYPCNTEPHQAMPAIYESRPPSPLSRLTPEQTSRALSALDYNSRSGISQDAGGQSFSAPGLFPVQPTKVSQIPLENSSTQQRLNWAEEMRLKSLGVLPAFQPSQGRAFTNNYAKEKNHDDPFTESPLVTAYRSTDPVYPYNSIPAPRAAPPAVKGTTSAEFRFPHSHQPHNHASPQHSTPKLEQIQTGAPANVLRINPSYQRDPLPFSAFLGRNNLGTHKKEMLLQTLENVVESSKTEGHLPSSTRTVLYDPLALNAPKPAQPSPTEAAFKRAQEVATKRTRNSTSTLGITEQERLEISDPLPWTDRPVSIEDSPTLITQASLSTRVPTQSDHLAVGFVQSSPTRFAVQPPPPRHTPEQVELWWSDRSRRESLLQGQPTIPPHSKPTAGELARGVMLPAYKTLLGYSETMERENFGRFCRVPEWCIDRTPGGSQSFYGDWGVPPSRVGRDPRYTPTFHEGRYTVFEEPSRNSRAGGGFGHRLGWREVDFDVRLGNTTSMLWRGLCQPSSDLRSQLPSRYPTESIISLQFSTRHFFFSIPSTLRRGSHRSWLCRFAFSFAWLSFLIMLPANLFITFPLS